MRTAAGLSVLGSLALLSPGAAGEFLSMDTLPSAHGWTFQATNVSRSEAATASLAGGLLTFNTMGSGNQPGGSSIHYTKSVTPDWTQPWFIESSVRLNAFESFSNFHGVYFGSGVLWVGLSPTRLTFPDLSFVNFSPGTTFHTYRFDVLPSRAWTFYADNVALKSGVLSVGSGAISLRLGDGTGGSNGSATYDYYSFNEAVPAPATLVGLVIGAGSIRRRPRR